MHDKLPPTDNEYLKALSAMICSQYETLSEKLETQNKDMRERTSEIKEKLEKSDQYFEKKLDKVGIKVDELQKEQHAHNLAFVELRTHSRAWGAFLGGAFGIVSSIVVAIITKVLGV